MAAAEELLKEIRIRLNDPNNLEFNNEELIIYLNNGLAFIETVLANNRSSLLLATVEIISSPATLPSELLKIDRVEAHKRQLILIENNGDVPKGHYSVIGNTIILQDIPATLYYFKSLPRYILPEDNINIYPPLFGLLKDYVIIKALTRLEFNTQEEQRQIAELVQPVLEAVRGIDGKTLIRRRENYYV